MRSQSLLGFFYIAYQNPTELHRLDKKVYLLNVIIRDKSDFCEADASFPTAAIASAGNLFSAIYSRSSGVNGSTKT